MSGGENHQLHNASKMRDIFKYTAIALLVLSFFCIMSRIDFIVHSTLYEYGLQFSYSWALEYWVLYPGIFVIFSLTTGFMFWLGSKKTARDFKISVAIVATVILLAAGGLQDIMFFVLWAGGLPPVDVIWWWNPWRHILGTWSSTSQIVSASLALSATLILWIQTIRKRN